MCNKSNNDKCKCGNGNNRCSNDKDKKFVVNFELPLVVQNFAPDKALSIQAGFQLIRVWEDADNSVFVEVNGKIIKLGE